MYFRKFLHLRDFEKLKTSISFFVSTFLVGHYDFVQLAKTLKRVKVGEKFYGH